MSGESPWEQLERVTPITRRLTHRDQGLDALSAELEEKAETARAEVIDAANERWGPGHWRLTVGESVSRDAMVRNERRFFIEATPLDA